MVVCLIVECANVRVTEDRTHEGCGWQMAPRFLRGTVQHVEKNFLGCPAVKADSFTSWQPGARPSHPEGRAPSVRRHCLSYLQLDRVITTDLP